MHLSRLTAKLFLFGTAALAAVLLGILLAGALLPRNHRASQTGHFQASPERIWAALMDIENYPGWRPDVSSIQMRPPVDGRLSWKEFGWYGSVTLRVDEASPTRHLVTRVVASQVPFTSVWIFTLTPEGDSGTKLQLDESREIPNPLYRLPVRIFHGGRASVGSYLNALGKKLGETPVVE